MNKYLYKIFLIILRYIPIIVGICYMLNTLLALIGIDIVVLSWLSGISILPFIFILIASFAFKFCLYHRVFLYYIAVSDIINWIDYLWTLPLSIYNLFAIHGILAGITIAIAIISYVKDNKKLITSNNR